MARPKSTLDSGTLAVMHARVTLDKLIAEQDVLDALETVRASLKATRLFKQKEGPATEEPDWNTRLASARLLLEYTYGKPTARTEITTSAGALPSPDEVAKRIVQSGVDVSAVVDAYVSKLRQAEPAPAAEGAGR